MVPVAVCKLAPPAPPVGAGAVALRQRRRWKLLSQYPRRFRILLEHRLTWSQQGQ